MNARFAQAALAAGSLFLGVVLARWSERSVHAAELPQVFTNQQYIDGMYSDLDLEDPLVVFEHIFRSLPPTVTVYPSEGYYYFRFPARGVTVRGTILLGADIRDDGVLSFGYTGEVEDETHEDFHRMPGRSADLGREQGLELVREDPYLYRATFRGRTVLFRLFDPGTDPPASLQEYEEYVGTTMDESGLSFHLVFDRQRQKLLWILNESRFLPESLLLVGDHLVQGARTKFVFFLDSDLDRKLLIGVHAQQVAYNSWNDGPFDQLPDTRVSTGEIELCRYLAAHTGIDEEWMDRYGNLLDNPGARIPAAPYRLYRDLSEFDFVADLLFRDAPRSELLEALTREVR